MWSCPLCGARGEGALKKCERCGYTEEEKKEAAPRDRAEERKRDYKRAIEERKGVLLMRLQSLDLATISVDEIKHSVSEALTSLDIPLKIDSEFTLELDKVEMDLVRTLEEIIEGVDLKLKESPDSPDSYVRLGNLEFGIGEFTKAINYYNSALLTHPNHKDGLLNKGMALFSLHMYSESVKCMEKLLSKHPGHEEGRMFLALAEHMVIDH